MTWLSRTGPIRSMMGSGSPSSGRLDHKFVLSDNVKVDEKFRPLLMSIRESNAGVHVRYDRIFAGNCSVVAQGKVCADWFVKQTGIDRQSLARCATSYRLLEEKYLQWACTKSGRLDQHCLMKWSTPAELSEWNENPTAIAYDVQVFIPADAPPVQKVGFFD